MRRSHPNRRVVYGNLGMSAPVIPEQDKGIHPVEKVQHQSRRGMSFEEIIELANTFYEWKGIALIEKQQVRTQVVTKRGQPTSARVTGRSNVDYQGIITSLQGRAIAIEAKTTSRKSFHVQIGKEKYDTIRRNQLDYLDRVLRFNGLAYWLIRFAKSECAYIVPHTEFRKWANPQKMLIDLNVSEEEISSVGHLVPSTFECQLDYLAPVIELYRKSAGS